MHGTCLVCADPIDYCPGHGALNELATFASVEMDSTAQLAVAQLLRNGARWSADPEVPNVFGLVDRNGFDAYVVVYLDDEDFECSAAFEELAEQFLLP